ncbi:hypothetical protein ETC03_11835 [Geobacillus sp. MMMUD3]|nr:hypothetical protein [Geobacillus sp. MMMUD3]
MPSYDLTFIIGFEGYSDEPLIMGNSPLLSLVSFIIRVLYVMKVILAILDKIAHPSLSPHAENDKHVKTFS